MGCDEPGRVSTACVLCQISTERYAPSLASGVRVDPFLFDPTAFEYGISIVDALTTLLYTKSITSVGSQRAQPLRPYVAKL